MIRGVYTAAAGLVARMARLSVVSNNLANSQTVGYKQDIVTDRHFQELQLALLHGRSGIGAGEDIGVLGTGPVASPPDLDLAQGALMETGYESDFAIGGPGFFVVQTANGLRYTREGSFERDANNQLVTLDGNLVMGEDGPITLPAGELLAAGDGTIAVDGRVAGRLRVVDFPASTMLRKEGANLIVTDDAAAVPATGMAVYQGYLESSNVDVTQSMVNLIELRHAYSMNARMMQLQDRIIDRSVNDVGRVG